MNNGEPLQESFLLVIGATLFIAVGCLVMTSVDSVPRELVVNALVLGTLSIVTGMVFVLDTCLSNRRNDKKSHLPKNTRYGDIARTRTAAVDTNAVVNNGVHVNGSHVNDGGVPVSNGGILKQREMVEKKLNGLLQTIGVNGHAVQTKNEGVQTSAEAMRRDGGAADERDGMEPVHQYGRKYLDHRGFSGHSHADWYDTDMDLPKMKKLEINVPLEESPDYRRRYTYETNAFRLDQPFFL